MKKLAILLLFSISPPALAQHSGHDMKMPMPAKPVVKPKPRPAVVSPAKKTAPVKKPLAKTPAKPPVATTKPPVKTTTKPLAAPILPMDHSQMDHSQMNHSQMDQSQMDSPTQEDHSAMDHSNMDHDGMDMSSEDMSGMTMPMVNETPPPEAGSGPARAADAIWGADAMRGSREQLAKENGGMQSFWFQADRAEYRARHAKDGYLWDVQGYYGGDVDKFWFKSEGEGSFGSKPETAEVQGLWSHAIAPFFDLQTGVRHDFRPDGRTYGVIGIQGLMPYLFEVDAAGFLSDKGDLTARIEGEYDQRITQRLILQPRAEMSLAAQDVPEFGIGAGIDTLEVGLRLRYEFAREFAPYIGIEQEWKVGQSARYSRAAGDDPSVTNYVVGIRFWF